MPNVVAEGEAAVSPSADAIVGSDGGGSAADPVLVTDLTQVLAKTLRALGAAGRPVQASRLAARAWWLLKEDHPRQAERINGTMHYLARLPAEPDEGEEHP